MAIEHVQVAVIGAGPTGLALAALLRQQGVDVLVLERNAALRPHAQAHVINTRTMEIMRELGVEPQILAASARLDRLQAISWRESLAGRRYGAVALTGQDPSAMAARRAASPTRIASLAQNRLEPILLERARNLGAEVRFATTASVQSAAPDRVVLTLQHAGEQSLLEADYLVACDGAASRSRDALGIEMIGPESLQTFISIYFQADLSSCFDADWGPVHWMLGSEVRGIFIGFDLETTWAFMMPYAEPNTAEQFTPAICERLLRKAIGNDAISFEITGIGNWNMSAQVANSFRTGRGFLAGDSAHRFPPTGGMGLNTGVQDAHNLAWKLGAVLHGTAPEALLNSYEIERRPVAERNCAQSVANAMNMRVVEQALEIAALAPVVPEAGKTDETPLLQLGLDGESDDAIAKRARVAGAIAAQAEHFDYLGLDIGFVYGGDAIVHHGEPAVPSAVGHYMPSTAPGARFPHIWLEQSGDRVSSLDLHGGSFLFLAGPDADAWMNVAQAGIDKMPDIHRKQIGHDGLADPSDAWRSILTLTPEQALFIRPDGHVAWRSSPNDEISAETIAQALSAARGSRADA